MKSKHARSAAFYYPYSVHPYALPNTATLSSALPGAGAGGAPNGVVNVNGVVGPVGAAVNGVSNGVASRYWVTPPASYYEPQMPPVAPGNLTSRCSSSSSSCSCVPAAAAVTSPPSSLVFCR